jgi:hypothetical protein
MVLEALGKLDLMLAKDLFEIKVGTLIGGLRLYKDTTSFGRCASYNIGGWVVSKRAKPIEVIRTPFYPVNTMEEADVFNSENALKLISSSKNWSSYDNWNGYSRETEWSFVDIEQGKPVGVHLGEFTMEWQSVVYSGDKQMKTVVLVYSKVLLGDGKVGFLVFNTNDILEKELQLL